MALFNGPTLGYVYPIPYSFILDITNEHIISIIMLIIGSFVIFNIKVIFNFCYETNL